MRMLFFSENDFIQVYYGGATPYVTKEIVRSDEYQPFTIKQRVFQNVIALPRHPKYIALLTDG